VNQGVGPFVLLDGLLGRKKAMGQTASLHRSEFLTSLYGGYLRCRRSSYLRCHGSGNETPLIAKGHGRDNGRAVLGLQPYERMDSQRPQQFRLLPPVKKLETIRISPSEGLSRCNLIG
jgi:hypothetical protein